MDDLCRALPMVLLLAILAVPCESTGGHHRDVTTENNVTPRNPLRIGTKPRLCAPGTPEVETAHRATTQMAYLSHEARCPEVSPKCPLSNPCDSLGSYLGVVRWVSSGGSIPIVSPHDNLKYPAAALQFSPRITPSDNPT